jgi:hypothetical protein
LAGLLRCTAQRSFDLKCWLAHRRPRRPHLGRQRGCPANTGGSRTGSPQGGSAMFQHFGFTDRRTRRDTGLNRTRPARRFVLFGEKEFYDTAGPADFRVLGSRTTMTRVRRSAPGLPCRSWCTITR